MKDLWIQDIMTQKFLDSDVTRIIMLHAMTVHTELLCCYKKKCLLEYIYRTYSDNPQLASINPDVRIRNIKRYGILDIKGILEQALEDWKNYATNGVLEYDDRYVFLKIEKDEDNKQLAKYTLQVAKMLQKKYFNLVFDSPHEIPIKICKNDMSMEIFGKSVFRNRIFEDVQYCPLCEEVCIDNLYAVHILPAIYCVNDEELTDKNNGLIMCSEHASEYINKKFIFKENGFVENINSSTVKSNMHLSLDIKNRNRREYIKRFYEIVKEERK